MRHRYWLLIPLIILLAAPVSPAQNSRSAETLLKRGLRQFAKGNLDGAITLYSKAIALNPGLTKAYVNRGKARRVKGNLDGAINDYEKALEIDPRAADLDARDFS